MRLKFLSVCLAAAGVFTAPLQAAAIEANTIATALGTALTEGSHVDSAFDSARTEGDAVVIEGLTLSRLDAEQTLKFAKVVIDSPKPSATGIFESPLITFTGGTLSGEATGTIEQATIAGVTVFDPAKLKSEVFGRGILFSTAETSGIKVGVDGETGEVSVDRVAVEAANVVDNIAHDIKGSVENASLPTSFLRVGRFSAAGLGLDSLPVDVKWDATRDPATGTLTFRDLTISAHDGSGVLSIAGVLGNLPDPRVFNDSGAVSKASKAEVHQLTVRYSDNSLTDRILDSVAESQGVTRKEYIEQLSAALPFLLLTLSNPAFQEKTGAAISGFLNDPHSLTVRVEPDTPVSGSEILSMLKSKPSTVPDRLKASIEANLPE